VEETRQHAVVGDAAIVSRRHGCRRSYDASLALILTACCVCAENQLFLATPITRWVVLLSCILLDSLHSWLQSKIIISKFAVLILFNLIHGYTGCELSEAVPTCIWPRSTHWQVTWWLHLFLIRYIFRSTLLSRPNKVGYSQMSVRPSVHKNILRFQWNFACMKLCYEVEVMHDGMQYDPIQGQGHEPFKVGNTSIFNSYLLRHLQLELATDHWFLN